MGFELIKRKGYSKSLNKEELWDIYKSMKTQRLLEERLLKLYKGGQLSGAVYPGIGQEASMAGIGAGMGKNDIFGGTHRDLGVQIKRGVSLNEIAIFRIPELERKLPIPKEQDNKAAWKSMKDNDV